MQGFILTPPPRIDPPCMCPPSSTVRQQFPRDKCSVPFSASPISVGPSLGRAASTTNPGVALHGNPADNGAGRPPLISCGSRGAAAEAPAHPVWHRLAGHRGGGPVSSQLCSTKESLPTFHRIPLCVLLHATQKVTFCFASSQTHSTCVLNEKQTT